jgi:hypothetical protein
MSDSPFLPFPSPREIWAAQSGWLFFVKWMIFASFAIAFSLLMQFAVFYWWSRPPDSNWVFVFVGASLLIKIWPLFGFHWRSLAWVAGGVVPLLAFDFNPLINPWVYVKFYVVRAAIETLLLLRVRRRVNVWLVVCAAAAATEFTVLSDTGVNSRISAWIEELPLQFIGSFWKGIYLDVGIALLTATMQGSALAWLILPVNSAKISHTRKAPVTIP